MRLVIPVFLVGCFMLLIELAAKNVHVGCKTNPAVAGYMSLHDVPVDVEDEIDVLLPDQSCEAITPERLRKVLRDIYNAKSVGGGGGSDDAGGNANSQHYRDL